MARGHIRKRAKNSNSWSLVIELERDPATGKRRQKWVTVHGTKRDAERELTRLLGEADRGELQLSSTTTLADFLQRWVRDYVEPNLAPITQQRYAGIVRKYLIPELGTIKLGDLKPAMIAGLQAKLRSVESSRNPGETIKPATLLYIYSVLRRALEHAVKWELIPSNPVERIDPPRLTRNEMRTFDADQARAVLEASSKESTFWHTFFALALTTGMRLGEIRGLRWGDLDLAGKMAVIQQTVQYVPGRGYVYKSPKTSGSRRTVLLGADVVALLRKHRIAQNEIRLMRGSNWQDNQLVFSSIHGTPMHYGAVRSCFNRICAAAGVPVIRLHDLRHTAATLLLEQGIHAKVVSERLGHSGVGITLQTYAHVSTTMQQRAADTLDTLLQGSK